MPSKKARHFSENPSPIEGTLIEQVDIYVYKSTYMFICLNLYVNMFVDMCAKSSYICI
jgi:hypothetical protein